MRRFCRHVKNLTAIFATRSTVLPVVDDLSLQARFFSWPCCGFVVWLDRHEPLYMFSHKSRSATYRADFQDVAASVLGASVD